jgi:hypothetical protein
MLSLMIVAGHETGFVDCIASWPLRTRPCWMSFAGSRVNSNSSASCYATIHRSRGARPLCAGDTELAAEDQTGMSLRCAGLSQPR